MAGKPQHTYPDDDDIVGLVRQHGTIIAVARHLGIPEPTFSAHVGKRGLRALCHDAAREHKAGTAAQTRPHVTSEDPKEWGDLETLLKNRGLRPQDWTIVGARVNEWAEHRQLRVDLKPAVEFLLPARADGWKAPPKVHRKQHPGGKLVALFGDHHAPHHDPELHRAVCEWLRAHQPDEWIVLGDILDLDAVSRHRHNPEWSRSAQECVDAGYSILRAYVQASPNSGRRMIRGNHEDRLRNAALDNLKAVHGLTQGRVDGEPSRVPVLSIRHLLRLDELDVDLGSEDGEYAFDQVQITPELAARHGWIARKGSGASALATIDHLRYSVVIGHTHRQSIVHHTAHSIDGRPRVLLGAEAGTLAKIAGGLGYSCSPDWQQGFATATVYPDGKFKLDLATWVDGTLLWRDWRCSPGAGGLAAVA